MSREENEIGNVVVLLAGSSPAGNLYITLIVRNVSGGRRCLRSSRSAVGAVRHLSFQCQNYWCRSLQFTLSDGRIVSTFGTA